MTERPILFNAPMVRAILAGQKTQTRRVMKYQIEGPGHFEIARPGYCEIVNEHGVHIPGFYCPYGAPGDRLWVRENFSFSQGQSDLGGCAACNPVWFWADGNPEAGDWTKQKPSIHMPRRFSRILLDVTDVHVERLNGISEDDAEAEGVETWAEGAMSPEGQCNYSAIGKFEQLWSSINGIDSWHSDPWVWVASFKRV